MMKMILEEFILVFLTYPSRGFLFLQTAVPPRYFVISNHGVLRSSSASTRSKFLVERFPKVVTGTKYSWWIWVEQYLKYILTNFCVIHRVDKDRSGAISTDELQQALSNGTHCFTLTFELINLKCCCCSDLIFTRLDH